MAAENGEPNKEPAPKTNHAADGDIVIAVPNGKVAFSDVGRLGTVVDGADPATGDRAINVNADEVRSKSRLKEDGSVSLEVEGSHAVGTRGQGRAFRTLRQRLEADGHVATVSVDPDRNEWGEDGILTLDGVSYVLQHVTVLGLPTFWSQANAGVATADVDEAGAVAWMREAIKGKAGRYALRERGWCSCWMRSTPACSPSTASSAPT